MIMKGLYMLFKKLIWFIERNHNVTKDKNKGKIDLILLNRLAVQC